MHLELQLPFPIVVTAVIIVEPVVVMVVVVVVTDDGDGKMNVSQQKYSHHMFARSSRVASQSAGWIAFTQLWDLPNSTSTILAAALLPSSSLYSNMEDIRIINIHNHSLAQAPLSTAQPWVSAQPTSSNVSSNSVNIPMNNIVITLLAHPTHDDPAKILLMAA